MRKGRPLPLKPGGSVAVVPGVQLLENAQGGVVFLWGMRLGAGSLATSPGGAWLLCNW